MASTTGNARPFRYDWDGMMRRLVLPPPVKLVAAYMSQYADNDGNHVRPGVDRLVDETGMSDSTVRRAQRRLRELGLIVLVRSGSSQGRRGKANEYKLAIPDDILDRVEMVSLANRKPVDNSTDEPVDNSDHRSHETGDKWDGEPSPDPDHRSPEDRCSDGTPVTGDENTGHSCDHPCTKTSPAYSTRQKSDHSRTTGYVARDEPPVDNRPPSSSARSCEHGNPLRRRRDGTPRCEICRKEAA